MFTEYYDELTNTHKGIVLMIFGFLLLAYQQEWFFLQGLKEIINLALLILSIACIGYGFYKLDGPHKILALIDKKKK